MSKNSVATIDRTAPLSAQLLGVIERGEVVPDEDPQIVANRIAAQLLRADTLEGVFAEQSSVNAVDLTGQVIDVRDAILRNSELENTDAYMLIDAVNVSTGELIVFNTSSPRIMAQIARAKDLGALPLRVQVIEVGAAKTGQNAPMGLRLVTT